MIESSSCASTKTSKVWSEVANQNKQAVQWDGRPWYGIMADILSLAVALAFLGMFKANLEFTSRIVH